MWFSPIQGMHGPHDEGGVADGAAMLTAPHRRSQGASALVTRRACKLTPTRTGLGHRTSGVAGAVAGAAAPVVLAEAHGRGLVSLRGSANAFDAQRCVYVVACTGTSFSGCLAGWFHIVVVRSLLVYATQLVQQLSSQLEEKKLKSLYNVVDAIGLDGARQLLADTLQLEANGGLTIADGSRRRTPGGVFFYLLKACVGGAVLVRCRMPTHRRAERDWRAQAGFISSVQADLLAREAPAAPAAEEATAP